MLMAQTKRILANSFFNGTHYFEPDLTSVQGNSFRCYGCLTNYQSSYLGTADELFSADANTSPGYFGLAPGASTAEPDADNPVVPEDDRNWCGLTITAGKAQVVPTLGGLLIVQTYTNMTEADITINCLYFIWRSVSYNYLPCMLAHEKFDAPAVVAPNESITFQYMISVG